MKTLKFKTNINCGGCVSNVTASLDTEKKIKSWNVDTDNPAKILTVQVENMDETEVIELVNRAGYKAEII